MKKLFLILVCLVCFNACASARNYEVSGEDENGNTWQGEIESNDGSRDVSGELTNENGETREFNGEWSGDREISGEMDDDVSIDLEIE